MKKILLFVLLIIISIVAYFGAQKIRSRLPVFFQSKSTTPSALSLITPAPSPSHEDKPTTKEEAQKKVAEKFLNLVKQQQGKEVLALFTPPETKEEANSYSYFAGLDVVGPRVFSTANLNFQLLSADIVSIVKNGDGTFLVNVKETRRAFDNTSPKHFDKIEQTIIVLKTIGWNWYVNKYFYKDDTLAVEKKYNALYPRN